MESHLNSSTMECDLSSSWNITVPTAVDPVYTTLELICAVLSIIGNSVIIFLFIKKRSLRTVKNCYITSLASADLLVGLLGIPSAVSVSVGLPRNFHACLIMTSILMLLCTGSILSLVAVTIDRFWSITKPLIYPVTMTHNKARGAIFVAWCLSAVVGLLPLFGWNRGAPPQPRCFFVEVMDPRYLVFVFFATIVTPCLFMAAIYAFIFWEVRRQNRKLSLMFLAVEQSQQLQRLPSEHPELQRQPSTPTDQNQNNRTLRNQLKLTAKTVKSIFIIVIVFFISWFPLYIVNTVVYFHPTYNIPNSLYKATIILSHFNSVWNPILYGWKMKDFRCAIRKLLCGIQGKPNSSTT